MFRYVRHHAPAWNVHLQAQPAIVRHYLAGSHDTFHLHPLAIHTGGRHLLDRNTPGPKPRGLATRAPNRVDDIRGEIRLRTNSFQIMSWPRCGFAALGGHATQIAPVESWTNMLVESK